jgi:cytochrome c oxidase assembly protein subunit 15
MDIQIFLEWFHRLIALFLGVLLLKMSWTVLRSTNLRRIFSKEIFLAFVLFIWQCILGGLTVLKLLDPSIVSSHLLTALLFFALLLWIWRRSKFIQNPSTAASANDADISFVQWGLLLGALCVYIQLGIGGMVSSNNAGLICSDFPTCHGSWSVYGHFLIGLQMTHRYVAFILFAFSLFLFIKGKNIRSPSVYIAVRLFPLMLSIQILLGVLNIFYAMPLWARIAHHANGILIFATVLIGGMDLFLMRRKTHRQTQDVYKTQVAL